MSSIPEEVRKRHANELSSTRRMRDFCFLHDKVSHRLYQGEGMLI